MPEEDGSDGQGSVSREGGEADPAKAPSRRIQHQETATPRSSTGSKKSPELSLRALLPCSLGVAKRLNISLFQWTSAEKVITRKRSIPGRFRAFVDAGGNPPARIRNQQVRGSNPRVGSNDFRGLEYSSDWNSSSARAMREHQSSPVADTGDPREDPKR